MKSQSAVEYLMTHGWSILIIAIIMGALLSLGVFNQNTFGPRAANGSCYVSRPNGAGSLQFIQLEGVCNGEFPRYTTQFNGQNSYFTTTGQIKEPNSGTFSSWVSMSILPTNWPVVMGFVDPAIYIQSPSGKPYIQWTGASVATNPLSLNTWTFVAATWSYNGASTTEQIYINGVASGSPNVAAGSIGGLASFEIGGISTGQSFNGIIANVQFYNASLTTNDMQSLYIEGIGGAPQVLQNLVAWWPLNGDAIDYSGNGNSGVPSNVMFTSQWMNGYTPP